MPSPRHQVSSWTGSSGWCHRSLPPRVESYFGVGCFAYGHSSSCPPNPKRLWIQWEQGQREGFTPSQGRTGYQPQVWSQPCPSITSLGTAPRREGSSEWPVRWARHHRQMATHSTLWIGLPRHNSTTAGPRAHVDSRGTLTYQQKYTSTPCVEVGAPPFSGPYSWRVTEFPAHSGCSKIFG